MTLRARPPAARRAAAARFGGAWPPALLVAAMSAAAALAQGTAAPPIEAPAPPPTLADAFADPRPAAAPLVILDGVRIDAPLGGVRGDPARGRALFADPAAGGCIACHAAPGLARLDVVPRILAARLPVPPTPAGPPPDPDLAAPDVPAPAPEAGDAAPPRAPAPLARPAVPTPGQGWAEAARPGPSDGPPLLPLRAGPDLSGVAARLSEGEIRLAVAAPDAEGAPAYHLVSPELGRRLPELRQPWFDPAQVEDVVAWLMTLDGSEPAAPDPADAAAEGPTPRSGPDRAADGASDATPDPARATPAPTAK